MDKYDVIRALEMFENDYGDTFADAYPEEYDFIINALEEK